MIEYRQYDKGCDEDGQEPHLFREPPVGARRQGASATTHHFRAGGPKAFEVLPGAPVTGIGFAGT